MTKQDDVNESCKLSWEERKWLMSDNADNKQFYAECQILYKSTKNLVKNLKNVLIQAKEYSQVDENFVTSIDTISSVIEGMKKISSFKIGSGAKEVENVRISLWKRRLYVEKLAMSKLANDLVVELLDSSLTEHALRLAHLYNESLLLTVTPDFSGTNVFGNACPMLLYPLRKLSMIRIMQAADEVESEVPDGDATVVTVDDDGLMTTGQDRESSKECKPDNGKITENNKLLIAQNSLSSNTSVEIYRALTKHLENGTRENESTLSRSLEALWRSEEKYTRGLLALSARKAPQLLGSNLIPSAKNPDTPKAKSSVRIRLTNHYQQVLWGEVGGYLEHILLWWSSDPLGSFPPQMSQSLRDYLVELKFTDFIPVFLLPSVNSLLDAMCCHLTLTSWDQLFRKTLVSAGTVKKNVYKAYGIEGSATGQLFVEMLADLIRLNNSCEDQKLNLEELPLVEQIPILHRLDHSVHMVRMWMSNRCRDLAGKWDLDGFYRTCHTDITKCLQTLNALQLINHGEIPSNTSVQVTVCIKMRSKLVSEIHENIEKLKRTAHESISVLAKDCRTECLAILHMCFPIRSYWKQSGPLPDSVSDYVEKYLDCILRPVFVATRNLSLEIQQSSSSMVLRILCESWLEYVYLHRIKFTEWGAVQLLTDFGAIPTWLMEKVQLPSELMNSLVSHEVLRRCEGVGRLLLRKRGESIKMAAPPSRKSSKDLSADHMPAEMYVPNQEQWLELRAPAKSNFCSKS